MKPAVELVNILAGAYRCSGFDSPCSSMRWLPQFGHVPRGYTGATSTIQNVQLIICLAEPGDPGASESYSDSRDAGHLIETVAGAVAAGIAKGGRGFHGNLRFVLNCCWPNLSLDEQLKRTWITEATLCSAGRTTGAIHKTVELECASRYLKKQIGLMPGAFVLALGRKAEQRLHSARVHFDFAARAVGRPIGIRAEAEKSWHAAGSAFQSFLTQGRVTKPVSVPTDG